MHRKTGLRRASSIAAIAAAAMFVGAAAPGVALAQKPAAAAAKKPDKKTRDAARKAYGAGEKAFDAGDFAAAHENYSKAFELIPSPHAQYWMAKALDKQGKVAEAITGYEAFLANEGRARAGDEKNKDAETRLEELKKTPGEVSITTVPPGATVSVDGQAQMGETPMVLKLAPGSHKLTIDAPDYEPQEVDIEVTAASKSEQTVELKAAAAPEPEPAPVVAPEPAPEPEPEPAEPASKLPAYITLGIAGAGAVVGGIFGLKALSAKSDFDDNPTNDAADDVERNALIADMAFGVAITLDITGIVLLTSGDDDPAAEQAKRRSKRGFATVAPYVSQDGGGAAAFWRF